MSGSVNKVVLIGRLGRDPEVRNFQNGGKVVNLRLATSESWRDKASGERKERTEWHSVAIHNEALARIAEQYLRKGSQVYIEGQLETRKWQDQSGADKYSTEVVLRAYGGALTLLDGRKDSDDEYQPQDDAGRKPQARHNEKGGAPAGGYGANNALELEEEIPF